ncbi:hypothetical protein AB3N04_20015 [Alkalihalophilus sp. As8PL]|uniref:Uncharacterized protein n=1 Tax=Alkalihalophilus sp. As8PL TaxID=3237103 RepID=A0AB39BTH9_9BACI
MRNKQKNIRDILDALSRLNLPGLYRPNNEGGTRGSCSNYCSNVCSTLYPFQFNQCFNDCIACQSATISETDESLLDEDEK